MQRVPHAPQFVSLVEVSTHWFLQVESPPPHAQTPEAQFAPEPHTLLHAPQLLGSDCVSTHALPQVVCPASALHVVVHCPFEQTPPSH